jgi:EAL domain-containing protein (putative c-di-GMP-specific phosphodiesterase class I)
MQGYFFAKPMTETEVPAFIAGMAEGDAAAG